MTMEFQHILVRFGEIGTKGRNQHEFEKQLVANIRQALRLWPEVTVERGDARILVTLGTAAVDEVMVAVSRVFGVYSLSPVLQVLPHIETIVETACRFANHYASVATEPAVRLRVEVRRSDKRFPMPSMELAAEIGGQILSQQPAWCVDLHSPTLTLQVEVRATEAYIFGERILGPGGLPVGSAGAVGLLLSGGIDSPVAGWQVLRRGAVLHAIHFQSYPFTSERALQKVEQLTQILAGWAGEVTLHVVPFTATQVQIRKRCPEILGVIIMRRMMMRMATSIAEKQNLLALVTGESLGQVASQTLESMQVIEAVTPIPVLRPLITEDKLAIIQRAQQIGTYATSILPYEDCCTLFQTRNPRTRPKMEEALDAEKGIPIAELVEIAVRETQTRVFSAHFEQPIA